LIGSISRRRNSTERCGDGKYEQLEHEDEKQHFLLTTRCRDFTIGDLHQISEARAYETFRHFRWRDGEPHCPHCGVMQCYELRRQKFKCRACRREFSVTSGTVFAFRKLSFKRILVAIWLSVHAAKGKAALQLSRELGVQYKTAWVLLMKIREAFSIQQRDRVLRGVVQMDGKYVGGHVKPANQAKDRVDRRLKRYQNAKRVAVLALRETGLFGRIFTRLVPQENADAAWEAVRDHVSRDATVITDEHPSYNDLTGLNEHRTVNHSEAYRRADGTNTNQIESFFSRIQRSYIGIHHRFSLRYFDWYAVDLAWREDRRRQRMAQQMALRCRR
jgi:transposase-like protein